MIAQAIAPLFPQQREQFVYARAPKLVYWEATQACALSCVHCRAEAQPQRNPFELDTAEAEALLRQIAEFGGDQLPQLVITGGDPLQRPDLFELIAYARGLGLSVSITPAGTAAFTPAVVGRLSRRASAASPLAWTALHPTCTTRSGAWLARLPGRGLGRRLW
jgi:AdoMet-dependent heme synthase